MPKKNKILRLAFIGCGDIADLHLKYFTRRKDVEVVAFSDLNEQTLARRASEFPNASVHQDYKHMLRTRAGDIDGISICTPNLHHAQPTIDSLRAGCHVMVEKPMAITDAECRRMVAAAEKSGNKLVVGFQYRCDPRTQYIRRAFDAGDLGDILYCKVEAMRRRGIPNWGVFGQKALQGGGPLIDIGVHALEMAHYAIGEPTPVTASADMFTYLGDKKPKSDVVMMPGWDYKTYNVEDLAVGRIRFANGAVIQVESSFAAHIKPSSTMNFQIMGTAGGATWDPPEIFRDEYGHLVDKSPSWLPNTEFEKTFKRKIDGFVEHILNDAPAVADGRQGALIQAMLNALYRSAESGGREVRIKV